MTHALSTHHRPHPAWPWLLAGWLLLGLLACDTTASSPQTGQPTDALHTDTQHADAPSATSDVTDAQTPDAYLDAGAPEEDGTPALPVEPPTHIGGERPAGVHVPDTYHEQESWPLVILLHGFSATGVIQDAYLGFSANVSKLGFVGLVPEGTVDAQGKQFWNATNACCDIGLTGVDDAGYLSGLIDEAIETLNVDPGRVYLLGHSNGGYMSFRMACDAAHKITAIASIAGATYKKASKCQPTEPVSILAIHGTADPTVQYGGGSFYPSADQTIAHCIAYNQCTDSGPEQGAPVDFDPDAPGKETTPYTWSGCDSGATVALWKMDGTGHIPFFNEDFLPAVMDHLLGRRK